MKNTFSYENKKKLFVCLVLLIIFVLIYPVIVFAGDSQTIDIIEAYKQAGILKNASFFQYFLRQCGWGLSVALYYLVLGLETVVLSINSVFGGFFTAPEFVEFIEKFKPLMIGLLAISIGALGFRFMFKPKMDKSKIATNIILSVLVVVGLPAAMSELYNLTNVAIGSINSGSLSIADEVLVQNVTDVSLYDSIGMTVPIPKLDKKINIAKSKIANIDPTETIDAKKMNVKDVWKNTTKDDGNGQPYLNKNKSEKFGIEFTTTMFYRFKISFFSIIITLIISALALVLSGIKIARLLYELAINQSIAFFSAVTDIAGGQRLKKAIEMILGTFVILFSCFFLLQLYVIGSAYCNENMDNIFARLIALGALAWAVIDGPNLVERIVGIDAGINSAFKAITGTYMASKALRSVSKGIGGIAKKTTSKAVSAISTGAGGVAGAVNGIKSNSHVSNSSQPGSSPTSSPESTRSTKSAVSADVSSRSGTSPISSSQSRTTATHQASVSTPGRSPSNHVEERSQGEGNQNTYEQTGTTQASNNEPNNHPNNSRHIVEQNKNQTIGSAIKSRATNSNVARQYRRAYSLTSNSITQPYQRKMDTLKSSMSNNNGAVYKTYHEAKKNQESKKPQDNTPIEMGW